MNNVAMIISKRLGLGVLTMFMVSIIIFLAVNMLPGDFAQDLLGQSATPEAVAAIRKEIGLDKPIYTRYFDWLIGVMQFDFGTSFAKANFATYAGTTTDVNFGSVADQIAPRFANTLFLAAVTATIAVPLSLSDWCSRGALPLLDFRPHRQHQHPDLDLQPGILRRLCSDPASGCAEPGVPVAVQHP